MKVCELIVGDLVLHDGKVIRVDAVHKRKIGYHKTKDKLTWLFSGQFEPIQLTPEILEKNGFQKDFELQGCYWRPDCRKYCIVKEIETWYFAFRHMGGGHICIFECNYEHELQHALKLCGIDKKIVV